MTRFESRGALIGALILEDGRIFGGEPFGAPTEAEGEAVFTTAMTGYQEVATDPSFYGQIVCMTYPLIGNYGITEGDQESRRPWVAGMVVREYCDEPENWRSQGTFAEYLRRQGIPALHSVDTRALTRHIREHGAMRALLVSDRGGVSDEQLRDRARRAWSPADDNVVKAVTTPTERRLSSSEPVHLVLIDCGVKENILRSLTRRNVRLTVVPYDTPAAEILALEPDGILTSPGPGDPELTEDAVSAVREIVASELPYMGICLGHQLLALAIGARTSKLKFGHRGANHPVKDVLTGAVHITSQNHGYQVDADTIPSGTGWHVSQVNLNDGSVEGLAHDRLPVFSIQYHPEGSPGPQDNQYLFDRFIEQVRRARARRAEGASNGTELAIAQAGAEGEIE